MKKSRDAFRTISEVAEWLDVPTHVLRFWESRFSQIKPVKRAGGRRYYRPSDMRVIGGVKTLLHDQGMTIRGVQKLFREQGIKHVSSFSAPLYDDPGEDDAPMVVEHDAEARTAPAPAARSTRDATPDPVEDQSSDADEVIVTDVAPVFSHREHISKPLETAENQAAEDARPDAEAPEEVDPSPAAAIPETPDVPDTDPADDDPDFAQPSGLLARLHTATPDTIDAARADLLQSAERMKALLDRAF